MNNRLGGILIMIGIFVFGFIYIFFFYLPEKAEDERLEKEIIQEQKKEVSLEMLELEENEVEIEQTSKEKMQELIEKNRYFKIVELDGKKFYFSILNNKLHLTLDGKIIGVFNLSSESSINVDNVYNSSDYYIEIADEKFIYNNISGELYSIDLGIEVDYVKKSNNNYLFNTEKGTFIYYKSKKTIEYFVYFDDFIDYEKGYIGIIAKEDTRRQNNLGIKLKSDYAIYFYNPTTKDNYVIYETNISLEKIYLIKDEIIFEDTKGSSYKLKNYMK